MTILKRMSPLSMPSFAMPEASQLRFYAAHTRIGVPLVDVPGKFDNVCPTKGLVGGEWEHMLEYTRGTLHSKPSRHLSPRRHSTVHYINCQFGKLGVLTKVLQVFRPHILIKSRQFKISILASAIFNLERSLILDLRRRSPRVEV